MTDDPDEFARVLDQAEATNVAAWALAGRRIAAEWEQRAAQGRTLPKLGDGSRGPATIMTSVLNPDIYFYWTLDHPELLARFRDLLALEDGRVQPGASRFQR